MKRPLLTSVLVLSTVAAAPPAKIDLPQWSEEDRKAVAAGQLIPGLDLLGNDPAEQSTPGPTEEEPPSPAEIAAPPGRDVPERFLEPYFAAKPQSFLVDPQGLLDPRQSKDREAFLRYHSGDSEIDLYVYLFGPEQEIPGDVRSEEIVERFFHEGKPAVVVYYFLGAPERSEVRVSPLLSDSVSGAEQRRALSTSLTQALEKKDAASQLEAFCVQMSIRLYWMEQAAGLARHPSSDPQTLIASPAPAEPPRHEMRQEILAAIGEAAVPLVWGGSSAVVLLSGLWIYYARRRYRFPEFEIPARLGGSHGAGIGAVISFGSSTQSPSTQRREVPDYLGGI